MNGGYSIIPLSQVRDRGWFLEPTGSKQLIESVFSTTVDDSWADYKYFYVLPLYRQHFVLYLLNEAIFRRRNTI